MTIPASLDQLASEIAEAGSLRAYLEQIGAKALAGRFDVPTILDACDVTSRQRRRLRQRLKKNLQGGQNMSAST